MILARATRQSRSLARIAATTLIVVLMAGAPAGRQATTVPAPDVGGDIDHLRSSLIFWTALLASGSPVFAPVALMGGALINAVIQGALWNLALYVENSVMQAWTMESLLEMDHQVRGAVLMGEMLALKLKQDEQILVARTREAFQNRNQSEEALLDEARLEAVRAAARRIESSNLHQQGKELVDMFDTLRRRVIQGCCAQKELPPPKKGEPERPLVMSYFAPDIIQSRDIIGQKLAAYAQAAADVEKILATPVKTFVRAGGQVVEREVPPTSLSFLKLTLKNASKDLVFFVRVEPKPGPDLLSPPSEDPNRNTKQAEMPSVRSRRWIALYPEGESLRLGGAPPPAAGGPVGAGTGGGPASRNAVDIQLPFYTWLPAQLGDTLQLRVVTYGEYRKNLRWMSLKGTKLRPDLQSLRRNFYYAGYEIPFSIAPSDARRVEAQFIRRMVTAEDYTWQFAGAWGPPAPDEQPRPLPLKPVQQNVPTNVPQLLGAPEWVSGQSTPTIPGLAPRNNEVAWTLPASAEEAKAAFAPMTATVSGRATIATRTRGSEGWKDERESGSGELSFIVELW